jgi:hypothetical protein
MTRPKSESSTSATEPTADSPGRPKDSGSRQQHHPDQNLQSGSRQLDKDASRKGGGSSKQDPKPASAK